MNRKKNGLQTEGTKWVTKFYPLTEGLKKTFVLYEQIYKQRHPKVFT